MLTSYGEEPIDVGPADQPLARSGLGGRELPLLIHRRTVIVVTCSSSATCAGVRYCSSATVPLRWLTNPVVTLFTHKYRYDSL